MAKAGVELHSGLWAGHYEQYAERHAQRMTLEFADGVMRGDGVDGIGAFRIDGEYRVDRDRVRMGWIKTYEGAHSVLYLGELEGRQIVGRWELPDTSGGFALLPSRGEQVGGDVL